MSKQKVQICNQLWSRRCNLNCSYCRIATTRFKDYTNRPSEYPDVIHYYKERPVEDWKEFNLRLVKHNPESFNVLYGGEIFLYRHHTELIKYMNEIGSHYTIITSANEGIRNIIDKFLNEVEFVHGMTCSIDPGFYNHKVQIGVTDDAIRKAHTGYGFLKDLIERKMVTDPVAEITACSENLEELEKTVELLSNEGITSSITMVDKAHNNYYDFSTLEDENLLVPKDDKTWKIFERLINSDYKIHMKDLILRELYESLPSNGDCELDTIGLHNLTIEPTGELRLCLRIRGVDMPQFDMLHLFNKDGSYNKFTYDHIISSIKSDKNSYCQGCNWTCPMMSKRDSQRIINH
ncbi:MAG: hypothetical protein ACOCQD_00910 [archaeon]